MNFLIKDSGIYTDICIKVSNSIKKGLDCKPIYVKKYLMVMKLENFSVKRHLK